MGGRTTAQDPKPQDPRGVGCLKPWVVTLLWNVHNPDGTRTGPLPTLELIRALERGSVSGHAWVRRPDDKKWQPLGSYEAFADFADPEASPEPPVTQTRLRFLFACGAVLFAFAVGAVGF